MAILGGGRHIRERARRARAAAVAALALAAFAGYARAAESLEYQVKAAFLLNFTKFAAWPPRAFADARSPITICVLGNDPFEGALEQVVEGETVNGRRVAVQRVRHEPAPKACQVLFIGRGEHQIPSNLDGVLTVGEGPEFLNEGGMIAFVVDHNRVRFDINQTAAANASIALSSKLLAVARTVRK